MKESGKYGLRSWEEGKLQALKRTRKWRKVRLIDFSQDRKMEEEGSAEYSPWYMWISPKFKNALNESEVCFRRGPQTFIQRFQESIQQLSLQYSALFALRQSCVVLMTFRTIDLNMWTSQELDFRIITTSKNNLSEIQISRSTPYDFLSVPSTSLVSLDITMHMKSLLRGWTESWESFR